MGFYRKAFPKYDRFLGLVAGQLPDESIVLDIGSNVGAVVAEMSHVNTSLTFLCAEPSPVFRNYLLKNMATLKRLWGTDVRVVENPIGFSKNVSLVHASATARYKDEGDDSEKSKDSSYTSIDNLCRPLNMPVSLIKVDIDGWDFEALLSGASVLRTQHPDLFFEVDPFDHFTRMGYLDFLPKLEDFGYTHLIIFDNFGNLLDATSDWSSATDFVSKSGFPFRERGSFFYVDIYATANMERFTALHQAVSKPDFKG